MADQKKIADSIPSGMLLPEIKMGKAFLRKTKIDAEGKTYEIEEEFDVPIFKSK